MSFRISRAVHAFPKEYRKAGSPGRAPARLRGGVHPNASRLPPFRADRCRKATACRQRQWLVVGVQRFASAGDGTLPEDNGLPPAATAHRRRPTRCRWQRRSVVPGGRPWSSYNRSPPVETKRRPGTTGCRRGRQLVAEKQRNVAGGGRPSKTDGELPSAGAQEFAIRRRRASRTAWKPSSRWASSSRGMRTSWRNTRMSSTWWANSRTKRTSFRGLGNQVDVRYPCEEACR